MSSLDAGGLVSQTLWLAEGLGRDVPLAPVSEKESGFSRDGIHTCVAVAWYMDSFQTYLQIGSYEKQATQQLH